MDSYGSAGQERHVATDCQQHGNADAAVQARCEAAAGSQGHARPMEERVTKLVVSDMVQLHWPDGRQGPAVSLPTERPRGSLNSSSANGPMASLSRRPKPAPPTLGNG